MAEKILIIDDDLETLRLVGLMLQRQGYQISSAQNGSEGIRLASIEKPNLIVLDLMMPDVDGIQVAANLKSKEETANIPILIFTAKSQVDDKVAGYDAGADDYLTKPVHPAELIAHIKALLARKKAGELFTEQKNGHVIGILANKGGMGVSSLAINLGILLEQKKHMDVIAAELRPGQGTWAGELNIANPTGLTNILSMPVEQIKPDAIVGELVKTTYGIRLLLASSGVTDINILCNAIPQLDVMLEKLAGLAQVLILDIGTPFTPGFDKILNHCDEIIIVSEPQPFSLRRTNQLIDDLAAFGYGESKKVTTVIVNRVRADLQLSAVQIQEILGRPVNLVVPPVPEQAFHAAMRNVPLTILQPDSVYFHQINRVANHLFESIMK
jgi:CheY-like chemotaxis protein/MinD-like ATPase involved in chromosome partitioning or flagellar assembly